MTILSTRNLRKIYGSGENEVHVLGGVDLQVEKGEFVAVVGTSGSGKSTRLHMLGGLDRPTSGTVTVDGKDIFTGRQIKRIILLQAGMLSLIGIPIGVAAGYILGLMITRAVVPNMDVMDNVSSMNPLIFVEAAVFALVTVFLSCGRPSRMAAKVSPY